MGLDISPCSHLCTFITVCLYMAYTHQLRLHIADR